jgi:transcriptional regulator with XRE-family HTH domain
MTATADTKTVIRHAVRRARLMRNLKPVQVARRMAALGYPWHPQTVANVESGRRRIPADELLGLALTLNVSVPELLAPPDPTVQRPETVTLPAGGQVLASVVQAWAHGRNERWVQWNEDDSPSWPDDATLERLVDLDAQRRATDREIEETRMRWLAAVELDHAQPADEPRAPELRKALEDLYAALQTMDAVRVAILTNEGDGS